MRGLLARARHGLRGMRADRTLPRGAERPHAVHGLPAGHAAGLRPLRPAPPPYCPLARRPDLPEVLRPGSRRQGHLSVLGLERRLRIYPAFNDPICSDCAGEPPSHVCERCGIEDCLYERGLCPRCVVHRRLTVMLGDESTRARNGLGPVFEALAGSSTPKAVLDWLTESREAVDALSSIGKGESTLS